MWHIAAVSNKSLHSSSFHLCPALSEIVLDCTEVSELARLLECEPCEEYKADLWKGF